MISARCAAGCGSRVRCKSSVSPRSTAAHAPNTVRISALCSAARAAIRTSTMPIADRILNVQHI
eukprot:8325417-Heterocapsa_arctica.AAC.1